LIQKGERESKGKMLNVLWANTSVRKKQGNVGFTYFWQFEQQETMLEKIRLLKKPRVKLGH